MPLYICGFLVLGAAFQNHLSVAAVVMGWGIALTALIVITVSVCEFLHPRPICEDSVVPRCVLQRLLPEVPGRDRGSVESCACSRWIRGSVLPSAMVDQARIDADTWLRGCVSELLTRACKMSDRILGLRP
jgi:hypothetical protein